MSDKLNQSLDEILSTQRRNATKRRSTRRTAVGNRPAPTAPAGGIQKKPQTARNANKPIPAKGSGLTGESKIMVSNLVSSSSIPHRGPDRGADSQMQPKDVSEAQIKVCYYR